MVVFSCIHDDGDGAQPVGHNLRREIVLLVTTVHHFQSLQLKLNLHWSQMST